MTREVLLGDEAVGLGALHAGLSGGYGYPGTPSTEIMEFIQAHGAEYELRNIHWSTNEKVAYEEALGMSRSGMRSIVTMKHVGLNVAADPFMNSALTGAAGGMVAAVADDPGMWSSQNEQDSRYFAQFGFVPCLEPGSQQEGYDMARAAFDLSEELQLPVMLRLVTRLAHSRGAVEVGDRRVQNAARPTAEIRRWTLLPANARIRFAELMKRWPAIVAMSESSTWNELKLAAGGQMGVIAAGIGMNYVQENLADLGHEVSLLKIGFYPLPAAKIRRLLDHCQTVLVVEDGYPFIERTIHGARIDEKVRGKLTGHLPLTGELTPDLVRTALGLPARPAKPAADIVLAGRPPALCQGCPHTDTYKALLEATAGYESPQVMADIGCYTLGALPPLEAIHSCVDMGASISMAKGAADCGLHPVVAVIGDSTFCHSGITSLLSAVQAGSKITVFVLDNSTVAMTGGQRTIATGACLRCIIEGCGVAPEHVRQITPLAKHHQANVEVIRAELEHPGVSVILAVRECIQTARKG